MVKQSHVIRPCSDAMLCCASVRIKPVVPTSEPSSLSIEYITITHTLQRTRGPIGPMDEILIGLHSLVAYPPAVLLEH